MKFKGQVKIPELDSPGVPAVILIEDPQAELFVEGESLGRWSLADVRAERLIASAFSLNLDGDEVTFIADDPINFAYGGVDQMAKVWARYKTMTMPRVTTRSRKGTKPSRIEDLRSAIEETLSSPTPTSSPSQLAPVEPPIVAIDSTSVPVIPVIEPDVQTVNDEVDPGLTAESKTADIVETPMTPADETEPIGAKHEETPIEGVSGEEVSQPLPPQIQSRLSSQESVFKDVVPWAEQTGVEPATSEATEDVETYSDTHESVPPVDEFPVGAAIAAAGNAGDNSVVDSVPIPEGLEDEMPGDGEDQSVPWLEPAAATPPPAPRPVEPAAIVESAPPPTDEQPRYVVDLGAFEQNDRATARVETAPIGDQDEMVLEPAMAGIEKGGIMGAVRSAFVRNRDVHDHEYVAAPGGIGIVRHICTHCGHISIGVSE